MAKAQKVVDEIENLDETFLESDTNDLPPDDIIAYNELRSCADLYRMYKEGILDIDPDFQRAEVWLEPQKTRFIDSLIKKLPIPSMCFSLDYKTEKWQVIDGLQRITSIIKFLDTKEDWKLSKLTDIDQRLSGVNVSTIKNDNEILYNRLANLTIPITVLRCDYSKSQHTDYLFMIFHRLNTGGIKLTNQEIRNAIYNGKFNTLLKKFTKEKEEWKKILGVKTGRNYRLSKEELLLRFFAFYEKKNQYESGLAKFLNDYMRSNRNPTQNWLSDKETLLNRTISVIYNKISDKKPLIKNSNVIIESLLYGVAKNIDALERKNSQTLKSYYDRLITSEEFSEANLREGLANKIKVNSRLDIANRIFSGR